MQEFVLQITTMPYTGYLHAQHLQHCFNNYGFVSLFLLDFEPSLHASALSDSSPLLKTDARVCFANHHDAIHRLHACLTLNKIGSTFTGFELTLLDFEESLRTYALSDSLILQRADTQVSIENYHDAI